MAAPYAQLWSSGATGGSAPYQLYVLVSDEGQPLGSGVRSAAMAALHFHHCHQRPASSTSATTSTYTSATTSDNINLPHHQDTGRVVMYANAVEVWSQPPLSSTGPYGTLHGSPTPSCSSPSWSDKAISAGQRITSIVIKTRTYNDDLIGSGVVAVCSLQVFYGGSTAGAANDLCSHTDWSGTTTTTT